MKEWNALERALRELHRGLLQQARADYVRERGTLEEIGPGELLMLATRDESFAWLRSLSELMADVDHLRDLPKEQLDDGVRAAVRGAVEQLLAPAGEAEAGTFAARYWGYVRQHPELTMAHAAVRQALQRWPAPGAASAGAHRELIAAKTAKAPRK